MHLGCAGLPADAEAFFCPDHDVAAAQPWLHAVGPAAAGLGARYAQPPPPPVRPNVLPAA
jgi:hypothetical protein